MKIKTFALLFIVILISVRQKHLHKEIYYQNAFSNILSNEGVKNDTEIILIDRTRCDIVTDSFAIEVDFASKWAESIGQSLHYGLLLNKKSGVLLILEDDKDVNYLNRLKVTAKEYNITIWTIGEDLIYKLEE